VLADLNGKPVLQHVYDRACFIPGVDSVSVAVPWADFGEIWRAAPSVPVMACRCADEADVLRRYQKLAKRCDAVMRLTGDCPVLNPVVARRVLELFHMSCCDFASNDTRISGYPDGWDVEVFSRDALETADELATEQDDREHVTPWMRRNLRCVTLRAPEPWTGPKKLSVDCEDDLRVVREWLSQQKELDR